MFTPRSIRTRSHRTSFREKYKPLFFDPSLYAHTRKQNSVGSTNTTAAVTSSLISTPVKPATNNSSPAHTNVKRKLFMSPIKHTTVCSSPCPSSSPQASTKKRKVSDATATPVKRQNTLSSITSNSIQGQTALKVSKKRKMNADDDTENRTNKRQRTSKKATTATKHSAKLYLSRDQQYTFTVKILRANQTQKFERERNNSIVKQWYRQCVSVYRKINHPYKQHVRSINYIHNVKLTKRYESNKKKLESKGYKLREVTLFHGTSKHAVDNISRQGFLMKYAGMHGSSFGRGVYLADQVQTPLVCYNAADNNRLLCCKVLLISSKRLNQTYKKKSAQHYRPHRKFLVHFDVAHILPCFQIHFNSRYRSHK